MSIVRTIRLPRRRKAADAGGVTVRPHPRLEARRMGAQLCSKGTLEGWASYQLSTLDARSFHPSSGRFWVWKSLVLRMVSVLPPQ